MQRRRSRRISSDCGGAFSISARGFALAAARALDDKKGVKILVLDVQHLTIIADYFVIASGRSANQVRALIDEVDDKLSELGENPRRREGTNEGRWAVLDYGNVLVHVFHEQEREYYNLERLWMDGSNQVEFVQNED